MSEDQKQLDAAREALDNAVCAYVKATQAEQWLITGWAMTVAVLPPNDNGDGEDHYVHVSRPRMGFHAVAGLLQVGVNSFWSRRRSGT